MQQIVYQVISITTHISVAYQSEITYTLDLLLCSFTKKTVAISVVCNSGPGIDRYKL